MPNVVKADLLQRMTEALGSLRRLPGSKSMFVVGTDEARVYLRYSKIHFGSHAFFGLREADLRELEGCNSFLCFFTNDGSPPLFVPYADFDEVFRSAEVAGDGQYKVQLVSIGGTRELYIPRVGRFNLDGYSGVEALAEQCSETAQGRVPSLSHCQVQTLLAGIGRAKGYDVYISSSDACQLDWSLTPQFDLR